MTYQVKNTAQTVTYTVNDNTENTTSTSLTFIGKNFAGYGLALNENFLYLLENFSNTAGNYPPNPVQGQLWWDSTYKYLNVYDGSTWKTVYGALSSLTVNGSVSLSSLSAGTIGNSGALLTGTLTTNAQPSITSVGNLSSLIVGGTITAPTIGNIGANHIGIINTNAQPYITNVGTLTSLIVSGNITAQSNVNVTGNVATTGNVSATYFVGSGAYLSGLPSQYSNTNAGAYLTIYSGTANANTVNAVTVNANVVGNTGSTFYGTIGTNSQPYITSVGTLTGLNSSGTVRPTANATVDLGSSSFYWSNVYAVNFIGTSTTAKYADLAEKYLPDADYSIGTVMMVGGNAEVTQHNGNKVRAIGVISAHPAYKMNSDLEGGVYIALKGRVPVKVIGPVSKGQALIGTAQGLAVAQSDDSQWMFAIALQDYSDSSIGLIEAVIL